MTHHPRKGLVLAICCMSLLIVSLDATVVNVALPSIRRDLNTTVSTLQWTIDGYTVAIASFLLLAGSAADRIGRRRVFQTGLVTFGLASLLCSLAPTIHLLILFRILQGIGGSMLNPVAMSIITNIFTERRERARAIGVWGAVVGVSQAFGPLVGGYLTEHVGWRSIFWVNVPIAVLAVVLTALFVPESKAPRARGIDPVGQVLVIVALASLVYALIEGPGQGWASPVIVALIVVAAAAVAGLIGYERRLEEPFLDMRFFRSVPFSSATLVAVLAFGAYAAFLFVNALYLQQIRGYSPFATGLYMLPLAACTLAASLNSGRMVGRFGTRPSLMIAGGLLCASGISLTFLRADTPYAVLLISYVLFGLGFGTVNAPITTTAVGGMPMSQAGVAAGVASTSRQAGTSIGVALAGTLTGAGASAAIGPSFTGDTHLLWWVVAASGLAVLLIGFVSTTPWAHRSSDAVRMLFEERGERAGV
ncbi:MFS transporter [Sinomonas terrae]|uniref:MFS transporter n=1 Tax=Sinomonas terrae TaxID=2908838 RepID=A0ABS9TWJ8_9MICC|nr:MFS transporter [Sinomonas terrae]MCH6468647.1 MFS transporter [Sinomonas terrae]